ncbi:MAG: hypothetical protein M3404_10185 [Actinomycetota bacterium]|nr:hypothetical protein [Actinomycetota bacterium]
MANESPHLDDLIHQESLLDGDGGGDTQHRSAQEAASIEVSEGRMDIVAAFEQVGTYRGAADLCGFS